MSDLPDAFPVPQQGPRNGFSEGEAGEYINAGGPERVTELSAGQTLESVGTGQCDAEAILKSEAEGKELGKPLEGEE